MESSPAPHDSGDHLSTPEHRGDRSDDSRRAGRADDPEHRHRDARRPPRDREPRPDRHETGPREPRQLGQVQVPLRPVLESQALPVATTSISARPSGEAGPIRMAGLRMVPPDFELRPLFQGVNLSDRDRDPATATEPDAITVLRSVPSHQASKSSSHFVEIAPDQGIPQTPARPPELTPLAPDATLPGGDPLFAPVLGSPFIPNLVTEFFRIDGDWGEERLSVLLGVIEHLTRPVLETAEQVCTDYLVASIVSLLGISGVLFLLDLRGRPQRHPEHIVWSQSEPTPWEQS